MHWFSGCFYNNILLFERMSAREKSKHLERLIRKEERSIERLKKERERMAKEQAERIKEAKNLKNLAQQRKKKWKVTTS